MAKNTEFILGNNIVGEITGDILTLKIDLTKRGQLSGSGKSIQVASTGGNKTLPESTVVVGINAYVKK